MSISSFFQANPHSIDTTVESIVQQGLDTVDKILMYLKETKWYMYNKMIDALILAYGKTEAYEYFIDRVPYSFLGQHDDLLIKSAQKILTLLKYEKYNKVHKDEVQPIEVGDMLRAVYMFRYYYALALTHISGYDEAVVNAKNITDALLHFNRDHLPDYDEFEEWVTWKSTMYDYLKDYEVVMKQIDEYTVASKVTKCRLHEIMVEENLNPELFYAVVCHEDFWLRKVVNDGFLLTRTKTLVQGNDFCDFCDHDTRFKSDWSHPGEDFWKELQISNDDE